GLAAVVAAAWGARVAAGVGGGAAAWAGGVAGAVVGCGTAASVGWAAVDGAAVAGGAAGGAGAVHAASSGVPPPTRSTLKRTNRRRVKQAGPTVFPPTETSRRLRLGGTDVRRLRRIVACSCRRGWG